MKSKRAKLEERFWSKVVKAGPDDCWYWSSTKSRGRAMFHFEGRPVNAARVAWMLTYGEIPEGMQVNHHCDEKLCCNSRHLFLGTQADNVQDMMDKGRYVLTRGEDIAGAKLTEEKVRQIRKQASEGAPTKDLAKQYGVSRDAIYDVVKRRTWKHVK